MIVWNRLLDGPDAPISFVVSQLLLGVPYKDIEKEIVRSAHKKDYSVKVLKIVSVVLSCLRKGRQPTDVVKILTDLGGNDASSKHLVGKVFNLVSYLNNKLYITEFSCDIEAPEKFLESGNLDPVSEFGIITQIVLSKSLFGIDFKDIHNEIIRLGKNKPTIVTASRMVIFVVSAMHSGIQPKEIVKSLVDCGVMFGLANDIVAGIPQPVFSCVTENRSDLPTIAYNFWESDGWLRYQRGRSKATDEELTRMYYSHYTVVHLLCAQFGDVNIFEFGGGTADAMYCVAKAGATTLKYVVLENEKLCVLGRKVRPEVKFFSDANDAIKATKPNGISMCFGALQYCLDWESALDLIVSCKPIYALIGRHLTPPDGKVFYAVQTMNQTPEGQAHCVFIPKDILIREMLKRGYDLLCDIPFDFMPTATMAKHDLDKLPFIVNRNFVFVTQNHQTKLSLSCLANAPNPTKGCYSDE